LVDGLDLQIISKRISLPIVSQLHPNNSSSNWKSAEHYLPKALRAELAFLFSGSLVIDT